MAVLDIAKFRKQFPQFADQVAYPDEMIEMYWETAQVWIANDECPYNVLNGKTLQLALNYMTAHLLAMFAVSAEEPEPGEGGSEVSTGGGFVSSATVGEVSVTKMTPPAKDGWEWWLEQSPYGAALLAFLQQMAVGGIYVGGLPERVAFRKVGGVFW